MAKRKRLSPATALGDAQIPGDIETKAVNGWVGVRRAPIADVSADAAARSAFEEVAEELRAAKAEGRMVARLPLDAIDASHLVRDRISVDDEDMTVLRDSLRLRGQQTPIEVVELGDGRYGLISGWRRLMALRALLEDTADAKAFGTVQALLRAPQDASAAYCAMVEENEVRADLSFYERARIAFKAVELGLYADKHRAVQALFGSARPAKRSKILSFVRLVEALDGRLRFPQAIPEKLGLAMAAFLEREDGARRQMREALRKASPADARSERAVLERILRGGSAPSRPPASRPQDVAPGIALSHGAGKITLQGAQVDAALVDDLRNWLVSRSSAK